MTTSNAHASPAGTTWTSWKGATSTVGGVAPADATGSTSAAQAKVSAQRRAVGIMSAPSGGLQGGGMPSAGTPWGAGRRWRVGWLLVVQGVEHVELRGPSRGSNGGEDAGEDRHDREDHERLDGEDERHVQRADHRRGDSQPEREAEP